MSRWKLLYKPEQYAKDAIDVIEYQLKTVKSASRRAVLEKKLNDWKLALGVMEEDDVQEKE